MTGVALIPAIAVVVAGIVAIERSRQREVHAEALSSVEVVALEIEQVIAGLRRLLQKFWRTSQRAKLSSRGVRVRCRPC
jgi:hypothetical protein